MIGPNDNGNQKGFRRVNTPIGDAEQYCQENHYCDNRRCYPYQQALDVIHGFDTAPWRALVTVASVTVSDDVSEWRRLSYHRLVEVTCSIGTIRVMRCTRA